MKDITKYQGIIPAFYACYDDNGEITRYVKVQPEKVKEIVESHLVNHKVCEELAITEEDEQFIGKQQRVVLRNCGIINPENIDEYLAVDGYKAIEKVLNSMKPEDVIEEIKISGLRGRGGAGFPTWFKWNAAKASPGKEKYLVCNADEGDPGAFMDRSVLEGDPHSLIEGMIIGLVAGGLAFLAEWGLYTELYSVAGGVIPYFEILPFENLRWLVLAVFAGAGALFGIGGSVTSIRKFMDV